MKIGVQIEGQKRNNIGDVFQALAVADHLPGSYQVLDRENLPGAASHGELLLIANGWYMHNYDAFPPPDTVVPVYTSIHFSSAEILANEANRAHFRKHGPIGARDIKTLVMLRAAGIQAYYSGCLTAGLKPRKPHETVKDLLVVDGIDHPLSDREVDQIGASFGVAPERLSNDPKTDGGGFEQYAVDAFNQAEALLSAYCSARHVVTTKIHCALPCMAMGIPVSLVHPDVKEERLAPAREFLDVINTKELHRLSGYGVRGINQAKLDARQAWIRSFISDTLRVGHNPIGHVSSYDRLNKRAVYGSALWHAGLKTIYHLGFSRDRLSKIYR